MLARKHLMLQISPGVGRGRTYSVTVGVQGHLLTLLGIRALHKSGKQKGLKAISLEPYTAEEKIYSLPSCRNSVHTLMRRTM